MNLYFYKREVHKIRKELKSINICIENRQAGKRDYKRKKFLEMLLYVYSTNISKLRQAKKKV
jgi:hypothetical protein